MHAAYDRIMQLACARMQAAYGLCTTVTMIVLQPACIHSGASALGGI